MVMRSLMLKIRFKTVSNLGRSYDRVLPLPDWFGPSEQWPEAVIGHLMARGSLNDLCQKHFVAILEKRADARPGQWSGDDDENSVGGGGFGDNDDSFNDHGHEEGADAASATNSFIPSPYVSDGDIGDIGGEAPQNPNLFGSHWLLASSWEQHGFEPFKRTGLRTERVGVRIVALLNADPTLEQAIPPHSEWAAGWVPMHHTPLRLTLLISDKVVVHVQPAGVSRICVGLDVDLQLNADNRVLAVTEGGVAATSGMQVGDLIHSVSGTEGARLSSNSSSENGVIELQLMRKGSIQPTDICTQSVKLGQEPRATTIGSKLIRALYAKVGAMRKADQVNLEQGRVLAEKDQPKSQFVFFPSVIKAYNASAGKCGCESSECGHTGRCGNLLCTGLAAVTTRRQARHDTEGHGVEVSHDYSKLQYAWSADRIYNWLYHLECNIRKKVICLHCQKRTSGLEQLTNPRFSSSGKNTHSIDGATYEERYDQCKQRATAMGLGVGGPWAALTVRSEHNEYKSAKDRDRTTVFTCLKCEVQQFSYLSIYQHCRRCSGNTSAFKDSPATYWEERLRTSDDGKKCSKCGKILSNAKSLAIHSGKCKHQPAEEEAEEEEEEPRQKRRKSGRGRRGKAEEEEEEEEEAEEEEADEEEQRAEP